MNKYIAHIVISLLIAGNVYCGLKLYFTPVTDYNEGFHIGYYKGRISATVEITKMIKTHRYKEQEVFEACETKLNKCMNK